MFNSKQKRAFHSICSGLKFSSYGKKIIRFLTLTTSVLSASAFDHDDRSINQDFQILKKRICRYSPYRLYKEGYISHKNMILKYGRNDLTKKFNFEYFKVQTNEGNGVLHILYRGSYLPQSFLVDNWTDIHNSWDLNIKKINLSDCRSASCYIVSQYVGYQNSSYVRSSQSWNWVFRGFKSLWYRISSAYRDNCLVLWDNILRKRSSSYFFPQVSLCGFG